MKGFFLFFFFATLGLSGCSSIESIDDPAYWIDRPATELIARWGEPNSRTNDSENIEILVFERPAEIDFLAGLEDLEPPTGSQDENFVQRFVHIETEEIIVFYVDSEGLIFESN